MPHKIIRTGLHGKTKKVFADWWLIIRFQKEIVLLYYVPKWLERLQESLYQRVVLFIAYSLTCWRLSTNLILLSYSRQRSGSIVFQRNNLHVPKKYNLRIQCQNVRIDCFKVTNGVRQGKSSHPFYFAFMWMSYLNNLDAVLMDVTLDLILWERIFMWMI